MPGVDRWPGVLGAPQPQGAKVTRGGAPAQPVVGLRGADAGPGRGGGLESGWRFCGLRLKIQKRRKIVFQEIEIADLARREICFSREEPPGL